MEQTGRSSTGLAYLHDSACTRMRYSGTRDAYCSEGRVLTRGMVVQGASTDEGYDLTGVKY